MHSENIIHMNIKPKNIFMIGNSSLEIKIGDYGLATFDKDPKVRFKDILNNYSFKKVGYFF